MIKYLQGDRARADSEKTCSEWAARWTDHDRTGANDGPEKSTTLIDPNERRPSSRRADLELVTEVPTKFRPRHADLRDVGRPPILLNRAAMGGDETPWPNSERKRTMNTTGKLRESTRDRYVQTLRQFESFLGSRNIVFVDDITNPSWSHLRHGGSPLSRVRKTPAAVRGWCWTLLFCTRHFR